MSGTLYLVATPIGNLGDITLRAVETLRAVNLVACEDTRQTGKLMRHLNIASKMISYHEHNERTRAAELVAFLMEGKSVAIVTDAGTPGIADPAFRIVQAAIANDINVVPIPGAVAFVNALIVSGLPTDAVFYGGFLPAKTGERRSRLHEVKTVPATLVFYETPHRLAKSLTDCLEVLGNRRAAVARELTKLHEEVVRGSLSELTERYKDEAARGEIVLTIDRQQLNDETIVTLQTSLVERVAELERTGLETKAALKQAAREFGLNRSEAYRRLVSERKTST